MDLSEWMEKAGSAAGGVVVGFMLARLVYGKTIDRLMGMVEKWNQAMLDRVIAEGE